MLLVFPETSSLRARRWCSLGPLLTRADSIPHYTAQGESAVLYAMQGRRRGTQGRMKEGGTRDPGTGRRNSLGLPVIGQQELGR